MQPDWPTAKLVVETASAIGKYWGNQDWHSKVRELVFPALCAAHELVGRVPDLTHAALLEVEIKAVVDLENATRLSDAQELLERVLLPWTAEADIQGTRVEVLAADVALNAVDWKKCESLLARAEHSLGAATDKHSEWVPRVKASLLRTRAQLQLEKGLLDLAFEDAQEAYELTRFGTDVTQKGTDIWMQVRIRYAQQRFEAAVQLWDEFCASATYAELQSVNPALLAQISNRVARCAVDQALCGDHSDQRVVAWLEHSILQASTAQAERNFARMQLATWYLDRGQPQLASEYIREISLALGTSREPSQRHPRMVLAGLALRHALDLESSPEKVEQSVAEAERALASLLEVWKQEPPSSVGRGPLFFDDRRGLLSELTRSRLQLLGPRLGAERALADVLALQEIGSLARLIGAPPASLETVKSALLDSGSGVLVYLPGRVRLHVFAIDGEGVDCFALDIDQISLDRVRQRLVAAVLHAQQTMAPAQDKDYEEAARAMFRLVFPGVVQQRTSKWSSLLVVGLESVGYFPFEVLQGEDGVPLGLKLPINYLPSLPVALALRGQSQREPRADLAPLQGRIVVGSGSAMNFGSTGTKTELKLTGQERQRLSLTSSGLEMLLLDDAETLSSAMPARGKPRLDFLHIMGHGATDDARACPQGIQLANSKVIWSDDFSGLVAPRLVLLSVCNAGRGTVRRGDDGAQLLSGALIALGTPTVVLPRVEVSVEGALAFAEHFQRLVLVDGMPPSQAALRARQLAHLAAPALLDPLLIHVVSPANAALRRRSSGSGDAAPLNRQRASAIPWIAGIALALAGLLIWGRARAARSQP